MQVRNVKSDTTINRYKNYITPACVLGGVLVLSAGQRSISKAVNVLQKELAEKSSEYCKYLTQKEIEAVQKLLNKGFTLKEINTFSKIQNTKNKKEFAIAVFDEFINDSGYAKLRPQLKFESKESNTVGSWFAMVDEIMINNAESRTKVSIINTIKHEIKHFVQSMDIIRTEGLGADALVESGYGSVSAFKSEFPLIYEKLREKERLAVKEYGLIPYNSEQGKKAQKYVQAKRDYVHLSGDYTDEQYKAYRNNLLEIEAYSEGDKITDKYFDYIMELAGTKLL